MNRPIVFLSVAVLALCVIFTGLGSKTIASTSSSPTPSTGQKQFKQYQPDENGLKKSGITLLSSSSTPAITQDQIQAIAATLPEYKLTNDVEYLFTNMTLPNFKVFSPQALDKDPKLKADGYINNLPVWFISFQRLNVPSAAPNSTTVDHETVYVVDAQTGEVLMGFNYR